jgi:acetyl-CoA acetyltransferase
MTFPKRQAAIVGVYTTEQGRGLARTSFSLELEAIKGAIADAGLTTDDIDGVVPMMAAVPGGHRPEMYWASQLGGRRITFGEIGYPNGVTKAALAISAGLANVVVVFFGKAGWKIGPGGKGVPTSAPRVSEWSGDPHGAYMTTWYALWAERYMKEFGVTSEDLAQVAVTHRYHATLNPDSLMGPRGELTIEDVVNSRMIASPLHLFDCALETDGGYAIVVASPEVARNCRTKPIWVLGGSNVTHTDSYTTFDPPWFPDEGHSVRRSGEIAFEQAGVTRDDIDVAALYDCFTITMLRNLEELGFCKIGEGAEYFKEGHTRLGGSMPSNTDGGLLSNTHCGLPHGLFTIEIARQLRGEAGARQVPDAKIGVSLAQGASVHGYAGTLIMAAD